MSNIPRPMALDQLPNRDEAWGKVKELLTALPPQQRDELWSAVCKYGHACATEAIENMTEAMRRKPVGLSK